MEDRTYKALEQSIDRWRFYSRTAPRERISLKRTDNPLCVIHRTDGGCGQCPVAMKTGKAFCDGSPYPDVIEALNNWYDYEMDAIALDAHGELEKQFRDAAKNEFRFLKSCRPFLERFRLRVAIVFLNGLKESGFKRQMVYRNWASIRLSVRQSVSSQAPLP